VFIHPSTRLESAPTRQGDMPTRELAQRRSGTDEIVLLWYPDSERLELSVCDVDTGAAIRLDVEPDDAMGAFHHPYAYVAWREDTDLSLSVEMAGIDC